MRMFRAEVPNRAGPPTQNFMGERNKLLCCLSHKYLGSLFLAAESHSNGFRNMPLTMKGLLHGRGYVEDAWPRTQRKTRLEGPSPLVARREPAPLGWLVA